MYVWNNHAYSSVFDGNNAPNGAAFHLGYYDAQLDNVSITNHQGSAIQVCTVNYAYIYATK